MHVEGSLWGDTEEHMREVVEFLKTRWNIATSMMRGEWVPHGRSPLQLNFIVLEEKVNKTKFEILEEGNENEPPEEPELMPTPDEIEFQKLAKKHFTEEEEAKLKINRVIRELTKIDDDER